MMALTLAPNDNEPLLRATHNEADPRENVHEQLRSVRTRIYLPGASNFPKEENSMQPRTIRSNEPTCYTFGETQSHNSLQIIASHRRKCGEI